MAAPGCLFRVSYRHPLILLFLVFFLPFLTSSSSLSLSLFSSSHLLPLLLILLLIFFLRHSILEQSPRIINNTTSHPRSRTGSSLVPLFLLIPDWTRIRFQQIQHIGCAFLCFFLYSLLYILLAFTFYFFFPFFSLSSPERRSLQLSDIPVSRLPACRSKLSVRLPKASFVIELTNNLPGMLADLLLCYYQTPCLLKV